MSIDVYNRYLWKTTIVSLREVYGTLSLVRPLHWTLFLPCLLFYVVGACCFVICHHLLMSQLDMLSFPGIAGLGWAYLNALSWNCLSCLGVFACLQTDAWNVFVFVSGCVGVWVSVCLGVWVCVCVCPEGGQ